MTQPIKMSFGMWTQVGPRNHVLDDGAHWCHLVNTTEPSMCCSIMGQVTLTTFGDIFDTLVWRSMANCWCSVGLCGIADSYRY